MKALRMLARGLGWVVLGLAVLVAVAVLAWLPFNVGDAAPQPRPAELMPAPARVDDARNVAYQFHGLMAAPGLEPEAVGRQSWAAINARAGSGAVVAAKAAAAPPGAASQPAAEGRLKAPSGPPLICSGQQVRCDAEWLAAADALAQQRERYGLIGERCDRLAAGPLEFEELLPVGRGLDAPLMTGMPMVECSRWLRSGAMVALARGDKAEVLVQLQRAVHLQRQLREGARTLIGHMVAIRVARNTYDAMASAALRDPALADPLAALLGAAVDTQAMARRWMVQEAEFQRGWIQQVRGRGVLLGDGEDPQALTVGDGAGLVSWLARRGIGFQAERLSQRSDAQWQQRLAYLGKPWPEVFAAVAAEDNAAAAPTGWGGLRWRNTIGEYLANVAQANYGGYLARHADDELHREALALVLALQRQRVVAGGRAQAAARLPGLSEELKQRMIWSNEGRTLTVRTWQSEVSRAGFNPQRDSITFTWMR